MFFYHSRWIIEVIYGVHMCVDDTTKVNTAVTILEVTLNHYIATIFLMNVQSVVQGPHLLG